MDWSLDMDRKASGWIENWRDSASHMGVLDELYEHVHGLDELEEQLGESVLGLDESGRRTQPLLVKALD